MVKHYSKKRRLKYVLLALACTAAFSLSGMAAACKKDNPDDSADDKTTSKEDTQLLKNGNFEIFTVPDEAVYLINTPTNWSHGGSSSYTMSGIIGTSDAAWDKLTADDLAEKLNYNNSLSTSAENYNELHVDYNGMKSSDILYKDTYAALNANDNNNGTESGEQKPDPKELIANPGTHYNVQKKADGSLYYMDGSVEKPVYVDENGDYFADEALKTPISHVLMLHNYATNRNGVAQTYSSVSVDLPANTAAEVSLWVKTTGLRYNQGKDVAQDLGANITVTNTVGGSTLDNFTINCINTEKLIKNGAANSNGWIRYTVYVNACDFASSTISLQLGLGESADGDTVEGYAFFDDVSVTKYLSLEDSSYGDEAATDSIGHAIKNASYNVNSGSQIINGRKAYCTLSNDESEKVFKADSYERNGAVKSEGFSKCFNYLLDLASENEHSPITFETVKAGLTVDEDGYVSAETYSGKTLGGFTATAPESGVKLPKDFTARNTNKDLLGYTKAGHTFTEGETEYAERLNTALKNADKLPKLSSETNNNMFVILSANGAAYTASTNATIVAEDHLIISFWVKTSDAGNLTVKIYEKDNDENSASFTVNTKDNAVDIDENNKDVYDGWAQCFLFVKNELKTSKDLVMDFSLGNTTIKDTAASAYKPGWVAVTNAQFFATDEDTFSHTGSGDYTATLTVSEDEDKTTNVFDEVYGSQQHVIEQSPVKPANYEGVNGGSSYIVNNGSVALPFDDIDSNGAAGLINKDYIDKYATTDWYQKVLTSFGASSAEAIDKWNEVFGSTSVQPLIILNDKLRDYYCANKQADENTYKNCYIKNNDSYEKVASDAVFDPEETYYTLKQALNYGFISASDKTFAADTYTTVSVKVKVSAGTVAYVYLTETQNGKNVIKYTTPSYTFRYDVDGNVLKADPKDGATLAEQKANVLYYLRDDGLYENADGALFANVWNYRKVYKNRGVDYYDKDGNAVNFEDLIEGVTYYKADKTEADCFLVAKVDEKDEKIYEFRGGKYYYIVNGKSTVEVTPFDISYAKYDHKDLTEEFKAVVDARYDSTGKFMTEAGVGDLGYDKDGNKIAGEWITVNFIVHTGSDSKNYRLELWSGARESTGVDENGHVTDDASALNSCVIFDYSYYTDSVSDDTLKTGYEIEIINAYRKLLSDKGLLTGAPTSAENIDYYRELAESFIGKGLTQADIDGVEILKNYTAHYYNYSFYDSVNFKPFNKDVADENSSGYDYEYENDEQLAFLRIKDGKSYFVFADYSLTDQSIGASTPSDEGKTEPTEKESNTTVWLLISSIILVVAMLFALMAILIKDMIKKSRRNKATGKNNYQQRNRYMRKLRITADEYDEVENANVENAEANEKNAEPAAESVEEKSEGIETEPTAENVEESAETEPTAENTESDNGEPDTPAEETPAENTDENDKSTEAQDKADENEKPEE